MKQNVNRVDPLERKACGLYLRVSTERQAQIKEGSLDTQLGTLKKFCEIKSSHGTEEWEVAEVYREEGKSGKNTDRPEYQKMIQDIKQGKLNVILCTKIDRIHRSLMDFYRLHELLEKHDVAFVSLNENWDTSTPMGRFGLKLTLAVAELEREQTSQRTREKLAWRAGEGLWNGGQILGYDIDPENKGVLKVNSSEAKIVQEIFETYLKLGSFRQTAQAINTKGYRSKSYESRRGHVHGNNKFLKSGIIHILSNPVYLGKVTHKGETFPARHQPIIDEKLWNAVNARTKANRVVRAKPREQKMHCFLLEGIIRCGSCGAYMTPSYSSGRSEVYFYYTCTSAHNGADECSLKRVSAAALEGLIAERLKIMGRDEAFVKQILDESNLCAKGEMAIIEDQRETQKRALAPIEQGITNIVRFVAQGRASGALARELEQLEIQKGQIESELERIDLEAREIANRTLNARAIQEGLGLFDEIWENATPEERKELMRFFVYKVIFTPTEVKMGLY
ncbi:MAG: recombinase family protein, partial [Proteobacteria bacterium]|nr:recombinase family protein [Pseudomonadota bacterium]